MPLLREIETSQRYFGPLARSSNINTRRIAVQGMREANEPNPQWVLILVSLVIFESNEDVRDDAADALRQVFSHSRRP
jgi:hypothetical protein